MSTELSILSLSLIVVIFTVFQRYLVILNWGKPNFKAGLRGDASVHFAIIRHLVKFSTSRFIPNYLISPEPLSYPIAFHHYARLFYSLDLYNNPWLPNFILSILATFIFMFLSIEITGGSNSAILVGFIVYFCVPTNWIFQGPANAYIGLSERYMGRIFCSLAYVGITFGSLYELSDFLIVGILGASVAFLSSIFARQALIFTIPLVSILTLDITPIICILIAMAVSIILGRSNMIDGWYHTILTLKLYKTKTKRSSLVRKYMLGYFRWNAPSGNFLLGLIKNIIEKDPTRLFFMYPELVFLSYLVLFGANGLETSFWPILFAPFFIYFLTLTEMFNHLGEAYRYLEYNLMFMAPIMIGFLFYQGTVTAEILTILILFSLLYSFSINIYFFFRNKNSISSNTLKEFLDKIPDNKNVVVFPVSMRLGPDIIAQKENWKSFWWQPGIISNIIYEDYIEEYPYLKKDWKSLAKRHGVTHIICEKQALSNLSSWQYDFSDQLKIAENESYVAYRYKKTS